MFRPSPMQLSHKFVKSVIRFTQLFVMSGLVYFSTNSLALADDSTRRPEPLASLKTLKVPEPENYYTFVKNKEAAIALGKAFFWEMRMGSDGKKACATCHFNAGADNRIKNQLAPAIEYDGFHSSKPNDTLKSGHFPFVKFDGPLKNDINGGKIVRNNRDVVGSQGVLSTQLLNVTAGSPTDETQLVASPNFSVSGLQVAQVTRRNTPTVVNAIFNLRNLWDGRAQTIFNGVNIHGKRDPNAGIYVSYNGKAVKQAISINDASIASLSTGPILDTIEMSAVGRTRPLVGRRILPMRILAGQKVAGDDSVLGPYVNANGDGLRYRYDEAIRYVFNDRLWNAHQQINIGGQTFTQMEANFSLFFGLAVQSYIATLVSDDAPFDRFMEGDNQALNKQQLNGLKLFMGKGRCIQCHDGATFTNAVITRKNRLGRTQRLTRMRLANKHEAVYDNGFYNIGVTRTQDDRGLGRKDLFGNPLSFSLLAKAGLANFKEKEQDKPNIEVSSRQRVAVNGAFKVPTLRNIALTAPYFHNGGYATLRQVIEFYNRGGNFPKNNRDNLNRDIRPLGLSNSEMDDMVAFLMSLTDSRVTKHAGPFDHPMLSVADGFTGNASGHGIKEDPTVSGAIAEIELTIPAIGKHGYQNTTIPSFTQRVGADHFDE